NSAYPRYVLDPLVGAVGGTVLQDGPGPFFAHAGQSAQGVQPGGVQVHLRLLPKGAGGSPALRALRRAQGRRIPHSQQDKQRRCRSGRRQKAQLPPVEILPYHCTVSSPKKKALRTGCGELFTGILPIYMVCTALPPAAPHQLVEILGCRPLRRAAEGDLPGRKPDLGGGVESRGA